MTAKKAGKPKVDLKDEINRLMTPDAAKELNGLSPTFQQFLIRWIDLRDFAIVDEMKTFFQEVYTKDNETMCKNVSSYVCKEVAETLVPIWSKLESISKGITEIQADIEIIKERVGVVEDKTSSDELRILKLEKVNRWWSIAGRVLAAVLISVIITFFIVQAHAKKELNKVHPLQKIENTR